MKSSRLYFFAAFVENIISHYGTKLNFFAHLARVDKQREDAILWRGESVNSSLPLWGEQIFHEKKPPRLISQQHPTSSWDFLFLFLSSAFCRCLLSVVMDGLRACPQWRLFSKEHSVDMNYNCYYFTQNKNDDEEPNLNSSFPVFFFFCTNGLAFWLFHLKKRDEIISRSPIYAWLRCGCFCQKYLIRVLGVLKSDFLKRSRNLRILTWLPYLCTCDFLRTTSMVWNLSSAS